MTPRAHLERRFAVLSAALAIGWFAAPVFAQFEMPDPREMAGIARPVSDLPDGSVSVRLIRGQLANNIVDHPVELHGLPAVRTEHTDENGRAQFDGLSPNTLVHAVAIVDGERLESQRFAMPPGGGVRVMLVATPPGAVPLVEGRRGTIVLGSQSRIFVEFSEEGVQIFHLLELVNREAFPVSPDAPLIFELPENARTPTILRDSTPQAIAAGDVVTVTGPFAPGVTPVQFAYVLPHGRERQTVSLSLPAPLDQVNVIVQRVGDVDFLSAQTVSRREMPADGFTFIVANGPPLPAGGRLTFELLNLPARPGQARTATLALALLIALAGVWASLPGKANAAAGADARRLHARREKVLADLVRLEQQWHGGRIDEPVYVARREELIAEIERLYGRIESTLGTEAVASAPAVSFRPAAPPRSKAL